MNSQSVQVQSSGQNRPPCIWMQAGIIKRKFCDLDFDCAQCRLDRSLQTISEANLKTSAAHVGPGKGKRLRIVSWKQQFKALPPSKRPCVYYLKRRIPFKACFQEYKCASCEFDQFFQDQYAVHVIVNPVNPTEIHGIKIPQGYYFHHGHTWVKIEEGTSVKVGIDDFALHLLGPFDRVNSPLIGKEVKQDQAAISIQRGGREAAFLAPISGVVVASNAKLREQGQWINNDPFSEGWVMQVHAPDLRHDLKKLMIHTETEGYVGRQIDRLMGLIEETGGPLATDGGFLGTDIYGKMPQLGWERLVKDFLGT